jgi:hypothetical protein
MYLGSSLVPIEEYGTLVTVFFQLGMEQFPIHFAQNLFPGTSLTNIEAGDIYNSRTLSKLGFEALPAGWMRNDEFIFDLNIQMIKIIADHISTDRGMSWD